MNKFQKYLGIFLLMMMVVIMLPPLPCLAASAKVDLTSETTEVTTGDTVYVYLKIDSGTDFGDFEADMTYDKSILKYESGASVITGGSGYLKISDMGNGQLDTSRKYALEFTALKVGECNLAFDGQVMVYDEAGDAMSVSSDTLTIKVKAPQTASVNANLKSLETSPDDMTPAFDKNVYEYTMKVDNETTKLVINAVPEDDKASVTISGNDFLAEGENKIIITVLAESGNIIEYTINVFREVAPTVTQAPKTQEPAEDNFEISQNGNETYIVFGGKFKLLDPAGTVIIPEGYSLANVTISGVTVHAFVSEDDPESDFILLYGEYSGAKAGLYQYDKVQNTLQRYSGKEVEMEEYRSDMNRAAVTIAFLITLSVLLLAVVIWLFLKKNHTRREN